MKALLGFTIFALATPVVRGTDESDQAMPDIVAKAKTTVEVLMRHIKSTGECFPDADAKVRFEGGRVMLGDFEKYENLSPQLSEGLVAFELDGKWGACDKDGNQKNPAGNVTARMAILPQLDERAR